MDLQTTIYLVVGASFALYIGIAIWARAGSTSEFYAAGGQVPPVLNGMATAADWMSAASFISMAGLISNMGYGGGLFLMGWTGGYVLLAMLLAPYPVSYTHLDVYKRQVDTKHAQGREPEQHDRAEHDADRGCSSPLKVEQAKEYKQRRRDDNVAEGRRSHLQALQCGEHGYRGSHHAVTIEHTGTEQPHHRDDPHPVSYTHLDVYKRQGQSRRDHHGSAVHALLRATARQDLPQAGGAGDGRHERTDTDQK